MSARISSRTLYDTIALSISDRYQTLFKLQLGLADGRAVRKPSDDPVRAHQAMWYRERLRATDQYESAIQSTLSHLTGTENAVQQILDAMIEVRELQVTGADDVTGEDGRRSLAQRVDQLLQLVVDTANSKFSNIYLFSGTQTLTAPYEVQRDRSGRIVEVTQSRAGDVGDLIRVVGQNVSLTINTKGTDLFGADGDVFDHLIRLRDALADGDGGTIRGLTDDLERDIDRLVNTTSTVGSLTSRIGAMLSRITGDRAAYEEGRSRAEDLDVAESMVEYSQEQVALQAALAVGSKILNLSLLDYM